MTKVFGAGSPEWNEGRDSQIAPSRHGGARPRADRLRRHRDPLRRPQAAASATANSDAKPDPLPDEAGGYTGFKALFGAKYVNPAINNGVAVGQRHRRRSRSPTRSASRGFPGFDGMFAEEHARRGRPDAGGRRPGHVRLHLRRARRPRRRRRDPPSPTGPARPATSSSSRTTTRPSASSSPACKNDGITKDNTLFVVTVEEGDHFAGTAPDDPSCDGVTTPCTYANGHVTEVNGDLKRLVATYNASHGTTATTNFSVHSDLAPNVYITGNPARDSATARDLEQAMSDMKVTNPLSGKTENLFVAMADPVEEKLLHMVTADPARTPTFTPFAQGDYFLNASSTRRRAPNNDLSNCVFLPNTTPPEPDVRVEPRRHPARDPLDVGRLGRAGRSRRRRSPDDGCWSDHTDIRPTMLALLGLKDYYVSDGRVVTEILKGDATAEVARGQQDDSRSSAQAYKQIMASFGAVLDGHADGVDRRAREQHRRRHRHTPTPRTQLAALGARARRARRPDPARALERRVQRPEARREAGEGLDRRRPTACSTRPRRSPATFQLEPADAKKLEKINHIVVIYEENHSFDNLYGGWEGVNGLANADAAHTHAGATRPATPTPASSRTT